MKNRWRIFAAACICCMFLIGGAMTAVAAGALTVAVSSGSVQAGETVTVTIYAADADNAAVTADMNITYDASKLEYVSSSDDNAAFGNGTVKITGSEVRIKFKGLSSGDAYVKAESASLTAAGTHIMVSGEASGTTAGNETDSDDNTVKSGDNSLTSLAISPGTLSPGFTGSNTQYTAQVASDVTSVTVTPVTSNSKAEIESITGNTDLKEGENVISVVVKAENGAKATYRITVTKGGGSTAADNPADTAADNTAAQSTEAEIPAQADAAGTASLDAIIIDGVNYKISEDFSDELIPEGFSRADFEYKGVPHQGLVFEFGHLGMYYLVNDAGEGKFFVYDADRDKFYPYARMANGEHFIVLMVVPNGVLPPEHYEEAALELEDGTAVSAYRYAGTEDDEIVVAVDQEAEGLIGGSDFYIFYAMDDTGVPGWYQYDAKQKTYQRFNTEILPSEDSAENYEVLLASYNELDERYKKSKSNSRRIIGTLLVVSVVLLFLFLNLILKNRDNRKDDEEERAPKDWRRHIEPRPETEPEDDASFYDNDDDDTIDEFEENPAILTRRPKKKAKQEKPEKLKQPKKQERAQETERPKMQEEALPIKREKPQKRNEAQEEEPLAELREENTKIPDISLDIDDELEFLDLNDL